MKKIVFALAAVVMISSCKENQASSEENTTAETSKTAETSAKENSTSSEKMKESVEGNLRIYPISHASMVLMWDDTTIYVDPVGDVEQYDKYPKPDMVLVTHAHGDHFDQKVLGAVTTDKTTMVMPKHVSEQLKDNYMAKVHVMNNGDTTTLKSIKIEAVAMYNVREEAKNFHPKGKWNGYVIERDGKRVYISGDTGPTEEMQNLKDIDVAFVCMNLPYTMTVESAAEAVLDFKPKKVYPYHYRGKDGLYDTDKFAQLVHEDSDEITVVSCEWYPERG
ncbi:hypothetical protein GCM10009117_22220 [Gangjinia marincola]|uniref:Metallo-beta-lactamase domain-containing protein n=1 Tax=Gangjinia marincola TaxID=578463 RepID=A0ABN1MIP5_9FLAO